MDVMSVSIFLGLQLTFFTFAVSHYCFRNFKYNDVHVESARLIARLARENGVERLIHFSSLNASPNPQQIYIKGGSRFLKTKVKKVFIWVSVK